MESVIIPSDLAHFCRWNTTSWAESWIFGFMIGNKLKRKNFGALIHTKRFFYTNTAHGSYCMREAIVDIKNNFLAQMVVDGPNRYVKPKPCEFNPV